jgi:uncharacterized protein involved in exopolysaccharide biosynthesis
VATPEGQRPSATDYIAAVTSRWRWVAVVTAGTVALTLALQFMMPNWYSARTNFIAESRGASRIPASLAGIASQFGVDVGGEPARSPNFYASLIFSEPIFNTILTSRFPSQRGGADSATLLDRLNIPKKDEQRRLELGRRTLRKLTSVDIDLRTSILTLAVELKDPVLAAAVANRFVTELSNFEVRVRQSQARTRRDFAARESEEIRSDLINAEETLRRFYERNREYRSAPGLVFEESRLRRQIDVQQELYLSVRRELETSKIAAANDAPSITVLSAAMPPVRKSRPQRAASSLAAGLLAAMLAIVYLTARRHGDYLRERDPESWSRVFTSRRATGQA